MKKIIFDCIFHIFYKKEFDKMDFSQICDEIGVSFEELPNVEEILHDLIIEGDVMVKIVEDTEKKTMEVMLKDEIRRLCPKKKKKK